MTTTDLLDRIAFRGAGLSRPECALAHASGLLFAPDWTGAGGVSVIAPSGAVSRILATDRGEGGAEPLRPNGIALEEGGSFLLAHLGDRVGGIYRLHPDGRTEAVVTEIDGLPMPPANFPLLDPQGRLWITVSTRKVPRADDYRPDAASGFVALHENGRTRIVADGLGYTNECALTPDGATLYVNETFARRTTAFDVAPDGSLSNPRTAAEYGPGTFPDGLALDAEGGLWITSIVSNRVIRVGSGGGQEIVLEDSDPAHLADVEQAFAEHRMGRPHLDQARSRRLRNISNLAFGGEGLRTAFLGCLLGDSVAAFDAPVAGLPPAHWQAGLGPLERYLDE